ncbi:MAG: hypothetical protein HY909_05185 [Deltaproteobacteria bacterium]|nr:hypothetical protein [Deltaproteobacteria bacterium]
MAKDLTREQLVPALLAWAWATGFGEPLPEALGASLGWLRARWDAGDDHLPLTLVHDLGYLLLRGRDFRFGSSRDLGRWTEDERSARLAYEDRVLGRWALDPSVQEAHVLIAGMSAAERDGAVAHAVGLCLAEPLLTVEAALRGNPAHLRALGAEALSRVPANLEGFTDLVDDTWRVWAREQLQECVRALPVGRLFHPEDLWELAHLQELPSESARLALREVNGLAARVGPVPPAVALAVRHQAREVPVDAEESDHYPAGGFDAIATKGTFENLMRSEVAYVGEGATETGGVDLFDVRFVEGGLLFYTRDESPLLDARRDVTLVLDQPDAQRHRHAGLPAQTLVLTQACALAFQGDLLRIFGPAGSRVKVAWLVASEADRTAAEEEQRLLGLTLAAELAHRRVELTVVDTWDDLSPVGRVVFSPRARDAARPCAAWVRVDGTEWTLDEERFDLREGPAALRAVADRLLVAVAKRHTVTAKKKKRAKTVRP